MRAVNFDIQIIIDSLQGTGNSISSVIESNFPEMTEDDLTDEDYSNIDNEIQCGWWCETSEGNENPDGGGDLCSDCFSEMED